MLYSFPDFDGVDVMGVRIGGPGLGNNLFPWARSAVYAHLTGAEEIRPTWPQFNPRRFARRDPDQRHYGEVRAQNDEISGLRKYAILARHSKVRVGTVAEGINYRGAARLVCHAGMKGMFGELLDWRDLLRERFAIGWRLVQLADLSSVIVAHVRRGDSRTSGSEHTDLAMLRRGQASVRVPDEWYQEAISAARQIMGPRTPVLIVTDGTGEELRGLLKTPGVQVAARASAWQDLQRLIGAGVRICGASTFSDWSAYLSEGPSIVVRGQNRLEGLGQIYEL